MNWLFWVLLIAGILLLVIPLLGIFKVFLSAALWIIGALLLIGVTTWAVVLLARGNVPRESVEER